MKKAQRWLQTSFVVAVVGAALLFGASQAIAGSRAQRDCPSGTYGTCTSDPQCQTICNSQGPPGSFGSCRSGCCWCFL
jgi:hypothetical protein